jgi:hypothetical protein
MHAIHAPTAFGQMLGDSLSDKDGSVTPAGAAERNGEVLAAIGSVARQQQRKKVG